ncbi:MULTISPECIES: flagellar filament capping protein FliD [unclassified Janthinobacterium]|uniref:flagellar filament capping protein FliD n=1 Tax=unclassified Janthinobacterium TaxID=2610881 RepID=UPI0012F7268A|nr:MULTISPECIES: flagellar filament capping protein FliD [unclassified Janthinobacterium]MEC5162593.1 hypothetical protein [Janthinobacterium sp. CG_S6]
MSISPVNLRNLPSSLTQFKGRTLASLFDRNAPALSSGNPAGAFADTRFLNRTGNALLDAGPPLSSSASFGSVLDQFSASMRAAELPTSTKPTGLDSSRPFSQPGQNVVTVLNRVEVSFKAQFSELGEMRKSLAQQQDAAHKLTVLDAESSSADIKVALDNFVASYNAGVKRFAPDIAAGGVLEGSWEAARARFATERDINNFLNGAEAGLKGGLAALGISTDPNTGLASIDDAKLDNALAHDKGVVAAAVNDFATNFVATVADLNATDHAQVRQMANLDRAVHWIDANKAAVQKEFGPGAAATPDDAFAKAAARYEQMARLIGNS